MSSSSSSFTDDASTLVGVGTDPDLGSKSAKVVGDATMVDDNVLKCTSGVSPLTPTHIYTDAYRLAKSSLIHYTGLPRGTRILEAATWGYSEWTTTTKLTAVLPDKSHKDFFLKCATYRGAIMMEGEWNSLSVFHTINHKICPKVYGWGKYAEGDTDTHFLLMDFLHISDALPDPSRFCEMIKEVHQKSTSPTGMFGFMVPNTHGKNLQPNEWDSSWRRFFSRLITEFHKADLELNGPWPEYEAAFKTLTAHTIPKLLDPLQEEGRVLKPCLVHGDLWEGNVGVDLDTGDPVLFDISAMYAHNEYELGMWRRVVVKFDQPYIKCYRSLVKSSEPENQWDDRNRLYSIKFNMGHVASFPKHTAMKDQ